MSINELKVIRLFLKLGVLFSLLFLLVINICVPVFSADTDKGNAQVQQRIETLPEDIPNFHNPVCLLVGLNASELSYREVSVLSGFELFSVPYKSDIKLLVEQIKPAQVVIKHPSGFVGLYSTDGQLLRGVQTVGTSEASVSPDVTPPSIIQPTAANPSYENLYYPGSLTGGVPHGGVGYTPPPKGRGIMRHLLKLTSLAGFVPFQFPGYLKAYNSYEQRNLFSGLLFPNAPLAIGAASTIIDSKLDSSEYEQARSQPRDYKFQPVIEGY